MRITAIVGAAALALSLAACGTNQQPMKDTTPSAMADKPMPGKPMMSHSGTFAGLNGKKVAGRVTVSGTKVVLSGFSSDEGPDLHLYLATGSDEAAVAAGMNLGKVAYDAASQTFTLSGAAASKYDTVVVHCDKAKAVFGAAALS